MPDLESRKRSHFGARSPNAGDGGTRSWRRVLRWWSDAIVVVSMCLLLATAHLFAGRAVGVLAPLGCGLTYVILRYEARREYKRGWRHGHSDAVRVILDRPSDPTHELRATSAGDSIPEPWDDPRRLVRTIN